MGIPGPTAILAVIADAIWQQFKYHIQHTAPWMPPETLTEGLIRPAKEQKMSKEEAVARAVFAVSRGGLPDESWTDLQRQLMLADARAAIAAADKWDAEQQTLAAATDLLPRQHLDPDKWPSRSNISAGQDAAIQEELDHPPASIMEEGK